MMLGKRTTLALRATMAWVIVVGLAATAVGDDPWPYADAFFPVPALTEDWTGLAPWRDGGVFEDSGPHHESAIEYAECPSLAPPEFLLCGGVDCGDGEIQLCSQYLIIQPGETSSPRRIASPMVVPQRAAPQYVLPQPWMTPAVVQAMPPAVPTMPLPPPSYPVSSYPAYPVAQSTTQVPAPPLLAQPTAAPAIPNVDSPVVTDDTKFGKEPTPPSPVERQQFLRTQSPLLKQGQRQFDLGAAYTLFEYNFPAIDAGGNLVRADLRRHTLICPFAVRYGWSDKTQLFLNVPVGWRGTELATSPLTTPTPVDNTSSYGGLGDITLGFTRLLRRGYKTMPDVVFTFSGGLPTGEKSLLSNATQGGLGTGFGSLGGQLIFIHTYDPFVLYWGGGCNFYFPGSIEGTPVHLGNQYLFQVGAGYALNDRATISTGLIGGYIANSTVNHQTVQNTQQEPFRFRSAVTLLRCKKIIEPFVEIGLTNTSPALRTGVTWTF